MDLKEVMAEITERSGAGAVFGPAIVKGGITLVPVARLSLRACGCGRGGEADAGKGKKKGPCMGVGARTFPLGYIEVRGGRARFVEIVDRTGLMKTGLILCALGLYFLGRMLKGGGD